jgi:hypothetical protein
MAHIYITFDFGTDEEKAQQARHKLDGWKQAFRLDKKLLYKFERATPEGDGATAAEAVLAKKEAAKVEKPAKGSKAGKGGSAKARAPKETKEEKSEAAGATGQVKLHLRLAFSGHEKMTEERWLKRIPTEEPFKGAEPETVKTGDAGFAEIEGKFEGLEG